MAVGIPSETHSGSLVHISIPISTGWQFKKTSDDDAAFLPVAQFPTNIHLDLMHHGLIPDPHVGRNELEVRWVDECAWTYRVGFASPAVPPSARADLVFDGLDTVATVSLNGHVVLQADNMFVPYRVDVSALLRRHGSAADQNELAITFESAFRHGWSLVEQQPTHRWVESNGDHSRLAVRKAQYHWGWDWGPTLTTCGPWRPVRLEVYRSSIESFRCDVALNENMTQATLTLCVCVAGPKRRVVFELDAGVVDSTECTAEPGREGRAVLVVESPKLWYPNGYGEQPLYTVRAVLLGANGERLHQVTRRIGIRRVRLLQRPLATEPGSSFFFEVNDTPIFCGGSCWIPADSFIPRLTRKRYFDWIRLLAAGHQCMLRVWGGGIYEEDHLYDACDELGVLVWQDFMFACGIYPAWPDFLRSVEAEARANVDRLRHHACIVLWAGNNEDYQLAEDSRLGYDPSDVGGDPHRWLATDFPARYIYEKLLPDVCRQVAPTVPYHPGSPWGGAFSNDRTVGDIHQWDVWHGSQEKYQNWDRLVGRFVSEFGMEAFPSSKTIDAYLPTTGGRNDDSERHAQSATVDFHNKAAGHERRLALYLAENVRFSISPVEEFVYATQLVQAECLASAFRLWRRQWRGPGHEACGGALVWQLNDCWPGTSWSLCDYYLRPKHAYFAIKRELAPLTVGTQRREHPQNRPSGSGPPSRIEPELDTRLEIWASNLTVQAVTGLECVVKAWNAASGAQLLNQTVATRLTLPANRSTEVTSISVPPGVDGADQTVVAVYLIRDQTRVARAVNWPEPLKHVRVAVPRRLVATLCNDTDDAVAVEVSCDVPAKGVALECDDDSVGFDDNLLDVVPDEVLRVRVCGATLDTPIRTRYMAQPGRCEEPLVMRPCESEELSKAAGWSKDNH